MGTIDPAKPLYIFVLVGSTEHPSGEDAIHDILQEYVSSISHGGHLNGDDVTSAGEAERGEGCLAAPAIRGSTPPFGTWSSPKVAIKISDSEYSFSLV